MPAPRRTAQSLIFVASNIETNSFSARTITYERTVARIPVTYYLWDGLKLLEERDAAGSLVARYTHGYSRNPDIGSVAEVDRHVGASTYFQYLHMDHRGTAYAVTDHAGAIQLQYTQDA